MKQVLVIEGGYNLQGSIKISGAKNAALPVLAATLLAQGKYLIKNCPELLDVKTFSELLRQLGATVKPEKIYDEDGSMDLWIDTSSVNSFKAPYELVRTMRASVLVLGPLVASMGKARVSMPGGCAIGERPIDLHLKGLELMGAKLDLKEGYIEAKARGGLKGAEIAFDVPTVTGTENLMMAAVTAKGETVLRNAAREPEIVCLGKMLCAMGAQISGLGTDTIYIKGVKKLSPTQWEIIPDRIEAGTYLMAVAAAGGELFLKDADASLLEAVISKLKETGLKIVIEKDGIFCKKRGRLSAVDVKTLPYPGFPTDLQAQIMAIMTTAKGLSVITETIFDKRFQHVAELKRLGADIRIEGRSAIIKGIRQLNGAPVEATDLRASASLVIAGLGAKGKTVIDNIYHLDRGYSRIEKKLSSVGAKIWRESKKSETS